MKILIVKLSAIGDVIHALPAVVALRRAYPDARIDWAVESAAAGLLENHPALDRVLVSHRKRWFRELRRSGSRAEAMAEIRTFFRNLRRERYDLVIDFQQLLKSAAVVLAARGRMKAGFGPGMQHMEGSHRVLNRRIPAVSMEVHALDRYRRLIEALGVPPGPVEYRLPVSEAAERSVVKLLAGSGIRGRRPLVAMNPAATWETKHWTDEGFAEAGDRLVREMGADLVFTGGPGDRPAAARVRERMVEPSVDLSGRTTLPELTALLRRVRLLVTTDTGPMHLSAAVGTPTVAVFGPTAPWRTGPYGEGHAVARKGLECSPCFKRVCPLGHRGCMEWLGAGEVVEAAARRLLVR
ncbi:MAG: lipopolysaccharide heptosyltransferase I [Desulfococcaceae bacterium]